MRDLHPDVLQRALCGCHEIDGHEIEYEEADSEDFTHTLPSKYPRWFALVQDMLQQEEDGGNLLGAAVTLALFYLERSELAYARDMVEGAEVEP